MKKTVRVIYFALLMLFWLVSCGPTSEEAVIYNNKIVEQQAGIYEKETALTEAIGKNFPGKFSVLHASMIKQIDSAIVIVKKMKSFDGKTDMKDAALKLLAAYKDVAENEYSELIKYARVPDSIYTQQDDDKVMEMSKKIFAKLNKSEEDFFMVQKTFAEKYKFEPANIETGKEVKSK